MIIKIIQLVLGKTPAQIFKRLCLILVMIYLVVFLTLQLSCGFDKSGNFYFWVSPAAHVDVNLKK